MSTPSLLQQLLAESTSKYYFTTESANSMMHQIVQDMHHIVENFKEYEAESSTTRAAPDTSKFIAHNSGMIEYAENVHIHGGYYGIPKTYKAFIKIGSNVKPEIFKKITEELRSVVAVYEDNNDFEIPGTLNCSTGQLIFSSESGSNWGGIGFYYGSYSEWAQKQYRKHTDGK